MLENKSAQRPATAKKSDRAFHRCLAPFYHSPIFVLSPGNFATRERPHILLETFIMPAVQASARLVRQLLTFLFESDAESERSTRRPDACGVHKQQRQRAPADRAIEQGEGFTNGFQSSAACTQTSTQGDGAALKTSLSISDRRLYVFARLRRILVKRRTCIPTTTTRGGLTTISRSDRTPTRFKPPPQRRR